MYIYYIYILYIIYIHKGIACNCFRKILGLLNGALLITGY